MGEPKARPGLLLSSRIYTRSCPRSCLPICYFFLGGPFRIFWRIYPRRGLVNWKSGARRTTISEQKGKDFAQNDSPACLDPCLKSEIRFWIIEVKGREVFPIVVSARQHVRSRTRNHFVTSKPLVGRNGIFSSLRKCCFQFRGRFSLSQFAFQFRGFPGAFFGLGPFLV